MENSLSFCVRGYVVIHRRGTSSIGAGPLQCGSSSRDLQCQQGSAWPFVKCFLLRKHLEDSLGGDRSASSASVVAWPSTKYHTCVCAASLKKRTTPAASALELFEALHLACYSICYHSNKQNHVAALESCARR